MEASSAAREFRGKVSTAEAGAPFSSCCPALDEVPWEQTHKPTFYVLKAPTALALARMAGPYWFSPNAVGHSTFTPLSDTSLTETKQSHPPWLAAGRVTERM